MSSSTFFMKPLEKLYTAPVTVTPAKKPMILPPIYGVCLDRVGGRSTVNVIGYTQEAHQGIVREFSVGRKKPVRLLSGGNAINANRLRNSLKLRT